MKLKPKPNVYEITYSLKKDPNQWAAIRSNEDKLQIDLAFVLSNKEWQLECVSLIATYQKNRYELPTPGDING